MNKASLTPSVILQCSIPVSAEKSFVRGKVTTIVNDSVLQAASPFRHGVCMTKLLASTNQPILLKFTDGGTDHRNTLESVKCATICLFRQLNLDMIILARCAPGHSWMNPAERVMSVLNLGLQNCALQRTQSDDATETEFRKCGSMANLRVLVEKKPELGQKWKEVIEPVQLLISKRFERLSLKDEPITSSPPCTDEEIRQFKNHLSMLFPTLNLDKLQKVHTQKVREYTDWVDRHCRCRHYTFQVRKCADESCCDPPNLPREELTWLPDPVLQTNKEHYKPYRDAINTDTTEADRPSLREPKVKPAKKRPATQPIDQVIAKSTSVPGSDIHLVATEGDDATGSEIQMDTTESSHQQTYEEPEFAESSLCTAQNARGVITCVECRKPRVFYCRQKLSQRQQVTLTIAISEYDYTCGAALFPPGHDLGKKVMLRGNMGCATPIEVPYYSTGVDVGRKDLCAHCGHE